MKMRWTAGALLFAAAVIGCGSSGENKFGCLSGTGSNQLCVETVTDVAGTPSCGDAMAVAACPRTGADGACVQSFSFGTGSESQTIWYYSGTAAGTSQEMSNCADDGGQWMSP